jgi:hypothetical protein
VISGDLARFPDFTISLLHTTTPDGTKLRWAKSTDVAANCNQLVASTEGDWLWILGDDHIWNPNLLMRLLALDLDVVVPLCLKRSTPFDPVVYSESWEEEHWVSHRVADVPEHGVHEVHAAGSAGMLIRRHVLDAIPPPPFEPRGGLNEDLVFCSKVREAGFKIHVNTDEHMGHIGFVGVWPRWGGERWGADLDLGDGQRVQLIRRLAEQPL